MTYHSLEEIHAEKSFVLFKLQEHIRGMSPNQASFHPSNGGWTIAEIAEHLSIVEDQMLRLIATLLKKSEAAGKMRSSVSPLVISLESIAQKYQSEKIITRNKFLPTGKISIPESLSLLQAFQAQLHDLKPRFQSVDLTVATFPHWLLGPLNLGQWVAFVGLHEARHLGQIESILTSSEFTSAQV